MIRLLAAVVLASPVPGSLPIRVTFPNFFPHSAVSRRVYVSAPQVPPLLDSLRNTYRQFQSRAQQPPPADEPPPV